MNWLTPAIIATLASAGVSTLVYYYLYSRYREKYLLIWTAAWAVYCIRFIFDLAGILVQPLLIFTVFSQTAVLLSGFLLLWGSYGFSRRSMPWLWGGAAVLGTAWIIISALSGSSFLVMTAPTFTLTAGVFIWTGVVMIRHTGFSGNIHKITGWAFILWGIHKADFPFLRQVEWFAPWGFLLASLLTLVTVFGIILQYFESTQKKLADSEKRFRSLIENSPLPMTALIKGRLLFTNTAFQNLFGYSALELVGMPLEKLISPGSREEILERNQRRERSEAAPTPYETSCVRKDGTEFPVEVHAALIDLAEGLATLAYNLDISERKQAENKIFDSEEKLRQIAENINEAFWVRDFHTRQILYVSPGYEQIWGRSAESLYEFPESINDAVHPDDYKRMKAKINDQAQGKALNEECRIIRPDGEIRSIWQRTFLVTGEDGKPYRIIGVAEDITQRQQIEDALRESENQFRTLVENIPGAVYHCDLTHSWQMTYMSDEITAITGHSANDFIGETGLNYCSLIPHSHRSEVAQVLNEGIKNNRPYTCEYPIHHGNGSIHWVSERGRAISDPNGNAIGLNGVLFDITARKLVEMALQKSKAEFKAIYEYLGIGISIASPEGTFVDCNPAVEKILGYTADEVRGKHIRDISYPEDCDKDLGLYRELVEGRRQTYTIEKRNIHKDGRVIWGSLTCSAARDSSGKMIFTIGTFEDISERKELETAVINAKQEWEATFDAVREMVILCDENEHILRCNLAVTKTLGKSFLEMEGRSIGDLFFGNDNASPFLERMGAKGQIANLPGWFEAAVYPVNLASGKTGKVFVINDITQRKQMESAILMTQKYADLGTLAASVAHEINSPLQVITGASETLLKRLADNGTLEPERLQGRLKMINENGWRVAEIVRSLLSYARASSAGFTSQDINTIINDTLLLIQHQLETWANIAVHTELAGDLPELVCDRNQIMQILINLLSNARDAMPRGGKISLSTGFDADIQMIWVKINDTGIGIPKDKWQKIFESFYTTKADGLGTGLGLSIVKSILSSHGGEIRVSSQVAKGSTFQVFLPLVPPTGPAG